MENNPLWYKDAVIYELSVRAFQDSDDDGVGDFVGLTRRLDYLESLGVTAIWLLPFFPSPLKDDGYDISDFRKIHPAYGALKDFKSFLRQAHARGIRVIIELVLNHTSNEHPWFQRARRSKPGSKYRDFYVWSDTPEKYKDTRIIFQDFETSNWTWDAEAGAYYWHRFYSHQPDLNFDSPFVRKELMDILDYWFAMGVDGVRLDAIPYLFERENTNCENLPQTHEFLQELREFTDKKYKDRMFLAEANQWPEDAAAYFGSGTECHMAFHFPLMPRMFMAVQMEDVFPIIDIIKATPLIPESCQWAIFLRNHDELTLEMVTDEERDYMYRVYAQDPRAKINVGIRRRLAPLMGNNRRKIELMNILLFSLNGTPVIYYGDEIGMGDNYYLGDRNGVRTPMQWTPDRNAGFSKTNPQKLYLPIIIDPEYHYESVNVENHEKNMSSLLWWMKRVIEIRKRFVSLSRGSLHILHTGNSKVLAFTRQYQQETMLVIVNLSRFSQVANIDIAQYAGFIPEEVFSQNSFPEIGKKHYTVTLGPYNHYWLLLKKQKNAAVLQESVIPVISVKREWKAVFLSKYRRQLEEMLSDYIPRQRWFGSKSKFARKIRVTESIPLNYAAAAQMLFCEISYREGNPETYLLPLSYADGAMMKHIKEEFPRAVVAAIIVDGKEGILFDSVYSDTFRSGLLLTILNRKRLKGNKGIFSAYSSRRFRKVFSPQDITANSWALKTEQSNSSIVYNKKLIFKFYRKLDPGINPELEISRYLTEVKHFSCTPAFLGAVEYLQKNKEPVTLGVLQGFVENVGDAWTYTMDVVARYFERVLASKGDLPQEYDPAEQKNDSPLMLELVGGVLPELAFLLGKRTAQMHHALSSQAVDAAFKPELFSLLYQKSLHQSLQSLLRRTFQTLRADIKKLPDEIQADAWKVLKSEQKIQRFTKKILQHKFSAIKIRIHGDYHLGQVLYTGKDLVIIDFEGEPARTLSERRLKHSPLKDIAGMLRSFHYVAHGALAQRTSVGIEDRKLLEQWIDPLNAVICRKFMQAYVEDTTQADFLPKDKNEFAILMNLYLLEKAVYELGYEMNNRPEWTSIPLKGLFNIINTL